MASRQAALFNEPPPKRTYRPVGETLAEFERIREEEPELSTAEIARKMGLQPKYVYKLLSAQRTLVAGNAKETAAGKSKGRADLAAKLCDPLAKLAMAAAFAAPTVSCVLVERGEITARALVAIAEDHPWMLKSLENVSKIGPVTDLAETLMCLMIAAMLDTGKMPPEHPLAVLTGNTARYAKMHPGAMENRDPVPFPPFPFPAPGSPIP